MEQVKVNQEQSAWSPSVDIRRCNGDLTITAELPGLHKEEIKVELMDDALVIQGRRKRDHKEDHEGHQGAETDQVKSELQDGVLRISVPVSQVRKAVAPGAE